MGKFFHIMFTFESNNDHEDPPGKSQLTVIHGTACSIRNDFFLSLSYTVMQEVTLEHNTKCDEGRSAG